MVCQILKAGIVFLGRLVLFTYDWFKNILISIMFIVTQNSILFKCFVYAFEQFGLFSCLLVDRK